MTLPNDVRKRNFFGFGEIISVLANPSATLRSLTESKRLLEEARRELSEARERAQIGPTHTFSSLPGFFDRPAELKTIERTLEGEPSFTVLFGASSVGKTALLRQVLTRPAYHVLHFDLRLSGFADLASLYISLSQQMEVFFMSIAHDEDMPGYEVFEKEAWGFKHDRLNVERRISSTEVGRPLGEIKTSDVARLMELFQSSLLRYWTFQPPPSSTSSRKDTPETISSDRTRVSKRRWLWGRRNKAETQAGNEEKRAKDAEKSNMKDEASEKRHDGHPAKKVPVFFIDEAHKLPALIRSTDAMKTILDAMLVLTKQDRLCHVIHATSDPFYQTWLRQLNVMQHCKIITIGDYPKAETRRFFRERILPGVPERLRPKLDFERLYDAFGGKLAHWQDYVTDFVNSNGQFEVRQSSHFLQAHALLNLHIIHAAQESRRDRPRSSDNTNNPQGASEPPASHVRASHIPSGVGFRIYSALSADPHTSTPSAVPGSTDASEFSADFTALQLLKVMDRFAQPGTRALSYFLLCREMGVRAVDGMVRGRILDLRWTEPVTREGPGVIDPRVSSMRMRESAGVNLRGGAGSSGTAVNERGEESDEGGMEAVSEEELIRAHERMMDMMDGDEQDEVLGPKLVPTTPIMRYAMREVVQEYYDDDDRSASEYESLVDPQEY